MTTSRATRSSKASRIATFLCLCASASAFIHVPSNVALTRTSSPSLPRLQVSISTGSTQVSVKNENVGITASTSASQKDTQLDWDVKAVMQEIWKLDSREIVLFDGECNLCNGGVNMLLDMDTDNNFRFCSLSSKFGKSLLVAHGKHPEDRDSIMVVAPINSDSNAEVVQSQYLEKSEAVMSIASKLAGAPDWVKAMTAVGTVAPQVVSDWFLQIVANNRHRINLSEEYESCRLDFDGEYEGRFLNDYEHEHLFQAKPRDA